MKIKPINQLYHQFLKPKDISENKLPQLVEKLREARFINMLISGSLNQKYIESDKLINGLNKDELFKIVEGLK